MFLHNNLYKYLKYFFVWLFLQTFLFAQSGAKLELSSIKFTGNNQFPSSQLKLVIFSQETPLWILKFLNSFTFFGKEASYFDSTLVKIDVQALSEFYNTNGFFESKIKSSYVIDKSSNSVDVTFEIDEGKPSNFGLVNLAGLISVPSHIYKNIQENFTIDTTKRFSQSLVQENVDRIVTNLQNNGFMSATFDSTIVYKDTAKSKANVIIYFTPEISYSISDVFVNKRGEGSGSVEDTLLRQLVDIKKGELYSKEKIRRSQVRLFRTGLFTTINVLPVKKDSLTDLIPIEINGTIGQMNELSPEVIVNNQQSALNIGLGATYVRKNFFGRARKFTAAGTFGIQDLYRANFKSLINNFSFRDNTLLGYADARITIEQPYVFDEPIVGIFETYGTITKSANLNVTKYGGKLSFEFEMPPYTFLNYLSTYYNLEINNEYSINEKQYSRKTRTLSVIGADMQSLKSDDPIFPTQGNNTALLVEEANLLSYLVAKLTRNSFNGAMFYKFLASTAFYYPLTNLKNTVWGVKFKTGHIQTYSGDGNEIPSDRKFFVGGSNSVRGWLQRDTSLNRFVKTYQNLDSLLGGTFMFEGSTELRFRYLQDFGTTLFADFGRSWNGYGKFRFDDIALAVGIGFRYYTTFAPLRVDFAFRAYDPSIDGARERWIFNRSIWDCFGFQFGIGEAF